MEVPLTDILRSNIFEFTIDFDEWPNQHTNQTRLVRPYNGSLFDLREAYESVFHEPSLQPHTQDELEALGKNQVYKIVYKVNLLPKHGEYRDFVQVNGQD